MTTAVNRPTLRWQDPPRGRTKSVYDPIADELRQNPGRWAVILVAHSPRSATTRASQMRAGRVPSFTPHGSWEFRAAGREVFARWIGE